MALSQGDCVWLSTISMLFTYYKTGKAGRSTGGWQARDVPVVLIGGPCPHRLHIAEQRGMSGLVQNRDLAQQLNVSTNKDRVFGAGQRQTVKIDQATHWACASTS